MQLTIEYEQEEDGRWLAEVIELPGVMVYGQTVENALAKAQVLALRVLADRLEHGEALLPAPADEVLLPPPLLDLRFAAAL